jgi:hypothetical protein
VFRDRHRARVDRASAEVDADWRRVAVGLALGDRHFSGPESRYAFATPEKLIADFRRDIARWTDEYGRA